ncbi:calmodulin-regulated spectrin-associated protein 3-like isoform X2 [Megalops cyprinoides]|uniref:calmodulin-regulated spectrin-associated protein 3-like isoform X2 n=1 Tax=Megalops cyprinoides TaxID=118141 RepID=UPI001864AA83|nr:calmodulin-regulated spectrin-associated protein 3-like isoform X2 [Megalops cyprinoides]
MVDSSAMRKTFTVPEIKPLDQYDFNRAKICASLGWLLAKSYGTAESVPAELREPFYRDQYEQEHIKPPVTRLLLSSELHCRAYSLLPGARTRAGGEGPPRDGATLLRLLAKRGVPPRDRDALVTEADLRHKPIKMSAHLAVIDALMSAGAMETVAAVKMPSGVEQLGSGAGWENTLLYWINRLNQKLRESTEGDPPQRSPPSTDLQPVQPSCPTRWYWKLVPHAIAFCLKESGNKPPVIRYRKDKLLPKQTPTFPLVTGVKDLSNGCAVAAVIHFYCPGLLRLEDVCLKDTMSVADSLYNLQLVRDFCDSCLKSCCPLLLEDLLYTPPALRVNIMSFMAELLDWFEVRKPDFVQPRETLDLSDASGLPDCTTPTSGNSNSASPSFLFKQPFLPISSPVSPGGVQEGVGRAWSRKQLSRPLSAVSFSIPFGLDSDVDIVMGNPVGVITRSVSSDSLTPAVPAMTRAPYTPPEDLSHLLSKPPGGSAPQNGPLAPQRASWGTQTPPLLPRGENGLEGADLPTIEEALQIIHSEGKPEPRLRPEGAADGFYLHSPDGPARLSSSAPSRSGMLYRPAGEAAERDRGRGQERRRSRRASDASRDDDSVLRDGSVDSEDASEEPLPKARSTPATPANAPHRRRGAGDEADSGVRMTSFAERKKKLAVDTPPGDGAPLLTTWAQRAAEEDSPSRSPALSSEMSELGARLEEKRRAIEAQKKRIEAIFAKHRQRLGKSALLQLKKQQQQREEGEPGEGPAEGAEDELSKLTLEERLARVEAEAEAEAEGLPPVDDPGNCKPPPRLDKQVTFSKETRPGEGKAVCLEDKGVGPEEKEPLLGDYNLAVSRLNAALSSLQSDMQRLSQQQKQLMRRKTLPATQAWVIPAGPKPSAAGPPPPRLSRESTRDLPSATSSPSPSRRATNHAASPKSPQASHRRAQSVPPKSPKHHHARPLDLKFPPLARVLTPPQNVDTLPHLRRVSPSQCQVQTSSSFSIGAPRGPQDPRPPPGPLPRPAEDSSSETGSSEDPAIFSLELEAPVVRPPGGRGPGGGGSSSGAPSECSFESDAPVAPGCGKRGSLIEISLSSLRPGEAGAEDADAEGADAFSDSMSDQTEPENRSGVGFFFKEEAPPRPEEEMAQRRAALLEKQQKRAEEMKRRKQEQEREREARPPSSEEPRARWAEERPAAPRTPPPDGTPQRRGDFTRQEYQRRQQLKIMEDLDKVLRQKPTTVRGVKKQRPKTVFRDDSVLSRSPAKGFMGSKLSKVYSHSSLNLSSMANDSNNHKKTPSRPNSPSRLMSPSRLANQNGEKDWENASTASSPASIPEYTGPKLYKEPSFKSNKFIIHNALSRCCLAGKVNELQRSKIVEEMEKCTANHFLILFRDSSCQFRAVYTMNPETEEMVRLTGIGPRVVSASMVESIYKYSSDRKQFTAIPSKTMSMSVDAFTIPGHLWQSKRPGTPKKPGTPK